MVQWLGCVTAMVNFMSQLDWVVGYPDTNIWLNIISRCVCDGVCG